MARKSGAGSRRVALTQDRVLWAAMKFADVHGVESLSMRTLGRRLGVEAMSLYNHVADKEAILDGIVNLVIGEIRLPDPAGNPRDWRVQMRLRACSAREVLGRHPWAIALIDSRRNPGRESIRYYDAVLGCLRRGGFTVALAAHAFAVIDSYVYGFCMQEQSMPFKKAEELKGLAGNILGRLPAEEFPYFAEMVLKHVLKRGYDFANEFDFGLDLILDGLESLLTGRR